MLSIFYHNKMKTNSKKKEGHGKTLLVSQEGNKAPPQLFVTVYLKLETFFKEWNLLLYKDYSYVLNTVPNFSSISEDGELVTNTDS